MGKLGQVEARVAKQLLVHMSIHMQMKSVCSGVKTKSLDMVTSVPSQQLLHLYVHTLEQLMKQYSVTYGKRPTMQKPQDYHQVVQELCPMMIVHTKIKTMDLLHVMSGAGAPTCPYEDYTSPDNDILCQLWSENVWLKDEVAGSGSDAKTAPVYETGAGGSEGGQTVTCPHGDPYADEKCMFWCENQELGYGNICAIITTPVPLCPYLGTANEAALCDLWEKTNDAEASGLSPSGAGTVPYDDCPYKDQDNGPLACDFWCQLQALTTGMVCAGAPTCPYENYTSPDNDILCQLWSENVWLKEKIDGSGSDAKTAPVYETGSGGSEGGQTVTCPHVDPYADEKCMFWCENQELGYGNICAITTTPVPLCPYLGTANEAAL